MPYPTEPGRVATTPAICSSWSRYLDFMKRSQSPPRLSTRTVRILGLPIWRAPAAPSPPARVALPMYSHVATAMCLYWLRYACSTSMSSMEAISSDSATKPTPLRWDHTSRTS